MRARASIPHIVRFHWTGDSSNAQFAPETRLAGYSNYFLKPNASEGTSRVPHYAGLTESNAMPGVSIRFHSNPRRELEFDFTIAPGTKLHDVAYWTEGADKLEIDSMGTLHLFRSGRELIRQPQPIAYEVRHGRKVPLKAEYVLRGTSVGFNVPAWTGQTELVIDPVVTYGTYFGVHDPMYRYTDERGPDTWGLSTAVDPAGNMYLAGRTMAFDIPITSSAYMSECPWVGAACVYTPLDFVTKLSSSGQLLYSTYLGGTNGLDPYHEPSGKILAADGEGFAYVTGGAWSDYPTTSNAYMPQCPNSSGCAVLTKLNQDGSALEYSTFFGGMGGDQDTVSYSPVTYANALALAPNGNVLLVGETRDSIILTTPGAFQQGCLTYIDGSCASGFAVSFNTNTNTNGRASLVFATYLGVQNGRAEATGAAFDQYGDAYILGWSSVYFPSVATFGIGTVPNSSDWNGVCVNLLAPCETFIAKLDGTYGQALRGATMLRGVAGTSIAVDASLNTYVAGLAINGLKTTTGAFQTKFQGGASDGFVTKISPSGYNLLYSTFLGGSGDDLIGDLAVNGTGMAFVTGSTSSSDFPLQTGAFSKSPATAFVTALNADGKGLYYSSFLGGGSTAGRGISVDSAWNAVVSGTTGDSNFPVTPGALQTELAGFSDAFLVKIVIAGDLRVTSKANATSIPKNGVVTYNAQVFNAGPDGSDNVAFTDAIPAGMSFAGVDAPNGNGCTQPKAGATSGIVNCSRTRLEAGQTFYVNVYLRAMGKSGTKLTNTMKAAAKTQDLWPSNNSSTAVVTIK